MVCAWWSSREPVPWPHLLNVLCKRQTTHSMWWKVISSSLHFCFKWVSRSEHGVGGWTQGWRLLSVLIQLAACSVWGPIMDKTTCSDFIHRYSYGSHTAPSYFGGKTVWVMENLLETECALSLMVCFLKLLTSFFINVLQFLPLPSPISEFQPVLQI